MTTERIQNGQRVTVRTDRGAEQGVVLGSTNTAGREQRRYTVRFDDRTQSTWNEHQVTVA